MNQVYRLDSDWETIGTWILPGGSFSNGTTGKLNFINGRFNLEIYGDLRHDGETSERQIFVNKLDYYDYILGFSQDGYSIILYNNHQIKRKTNYPGMTYSEYVVGQSMFMKINYTNFSNTPETLLQHIVEIGIDNIECSGSQFSFKGNNEWMNSSVIQRTMREKGHSISFDLENFEKDVFELSDYNINLNNS